MFESFRQSDASATRAQGGLGVGLAIAKHLVELHGGTLDGRSEGLGHGATFLARLPIGSLVAPSPTAVKHAPAVREQRGAVLPRGMDGVSVLVVDDEQDARELLQVVLEACGVEVRLAGSAASAMEQLQSFQPDVIISDIGMPNEDGYSFIQKVRTSPTESVRRIPAIALTAYATAEDRSRALLAGFNLHTTKPADPGALVTMVADLVGRATSSGPPDLP